MAQTPEIVHCAALSSSLLAADELTPFEVYNKTGAATVLLVCDHASRFIPRALCGLGLGEEELCRHIAWDIGIADVTKGLAMLLDAPAVLSQFSRLIIDPNRPHDDELLVPQVSDGVAVPGNRDITPLAQAARIAEFHAPYHAAVADALAALLQQPKSHADLLPALISMHSFTPVMNGFKRPWHIGILWDRDERLPCRSWSRSDSVALRWATTNLTLVATRMAIPCAVMRSLAACRMCWSRCGKI